MKIKIKVEGPPGSGKSTVLNLIYNMLKTTGDYSVFMELKKEHEMTLEKLPKPCPHCHGTGKLL